MDFANELKYLMKNSRHITDKEIREKTKQYKLSIKRGMKFEVNGDSKEYNVFPGQSITFTYSLRHFSHIRPPQLVT